MARSEPATFRARDRAAWRSWLRRHHRTAPAIWLVYRHTGRKSIRYPEALDEALCFGWIDGIVKRIDEDSYMQRFTPRRDPARWSPTNLRHMKRLIAAGRMTPAGLRVLGVPLAGAATDKPPTSRPPASDEPPPFLRAALRRNRRAAAFFAALAPSHRRRYVAWLLDAKREETRARRLAEALRLLAARTKKLLK
jgi:uncharacterized protein YdeI (YjbR/CyaY-like superfamily)